MGRAKGNAGSVERFFWKVQKTDTCWLWTDSVSGSGYGQFWQLGARIQAHQIAFRDLIGPIPEGLTLDHLCRVRACVNYAHLEPVTNRENILRGVGFAARNASVVRLRDKARSVMLRANLP